MPQTCLPKVEIENWKVPTLKLNVLNDRLPKRWRPWKFIALAMVVPWRFMHAAVHQPCAFAARPPVSHRPCLKGLRVSLRWLLAKLQMTGFELARTNLSQRLSIFAQKLIWYVVLFWHSLLVSYLNQGLRLVKFHFEMGMVGVKVSRTVLSLFIMFYPSKGSLMSRLVLIDEHSTWHATKHWRHVSIRIPQVRIFQGSTTEWMFWTHRKRPERRSPPFQWRPCPPYPPCAASLWKDTWRSAKTMRRLC